MIYLSYIYNSAEVTLGEGNTPLIRSARIGPSLGLPGLYFKLENCNPSGSYKDRFGASEMARLLRSGARSCLATSSGNTGSSVAAFCARYAIKCTIVVGELVPAGKLAQMQAYGASVLRIAQYDTSAEVGIQVDRILQEYATRRRIPFVVSSYTSCPEGMAGVESISRELDRQMEGSLDHVFIPVGGGGLFSAVCRGFLRTSRALPRLHAVQPEGCAPIVAAYQRGDDQVLPVISTTCVTGISVSYNIDGDLVLQYLRQSGGCGLTVSDREVLDAQRMLLDEEGVFTEPAGAAALAGVIRAVEEGRIERSGSMVCLVTGSGFKDMDSILQAAADRPAAWVSPEDLEHQLIQSEMSTASPARRDRNAV